MTALSLLTVSALLSYFAAFLLPALDAVLPVVPSEAAVIALGVTTAGSSDPRIAVLLILAAAGAFAGDNLGYLIGSRFGHLAERRLFAGVAGARRQARIKQSLNRFGARLILVCRFIPGGRTAVTMTCGLVGYRRKSFATATASSAIIWACYAFFLGRLGGKAFADRPWAGLLLALGATLLVSGLVEGLRWILSRHRPRGRWLTTARLRGPVLSGSDSHGRPARRSRCRILAGGRSPIRAPEEPDRDSASRSGARASGW